MSKGRIGSFFLVLLFLIVALPEACSASALELELTDFIRRVYYNTDIQITFTQLPSHIKQGARPKTISFTKVPDANGDGICMVGIEGRNGTETNVYVPFKVFVKRKLYMVKHNIKRGNPVLLKNISEKETYLNGPGIAYPAGMEDVLGKVAKKEIYAGEIITRQLLEDHLAIQKGEVVKITAENKRLFIQAKGTALEKGKVGDLVRVKSTSGKEVIGKITGNSTISIEF